MYHLSLIFQSRTASILSQHRLQMLQQDFEAPAPPNDTLYLKIKSLRTSDIDPKYFAIKVTFFDQLLVHAIIKSIGSKDEEPTNFIANGTFAYDPSDYEKMCLFADNPLVVQVQPLRSIDVSKISINMDIGNFIKITHTSSISCCNIDILSIFIGSNEEQKMCIRKRLEPMVPPTTINAKSWDTLPLVTMELVLERDPLNKVHNMMLQNANWMKITLIGSYNMFIPFEKDYLYTAATKSPLYCEAVGRCSVGTLTTKDLQVHSVLRVQLLNIQMKLCLDLDEPYNLFNLCGVMKAGHVEQRGWYSRSQ
ncbi:unnamed protein product [Spodoptera littoralis]|uniref:Uncharacterized protein n=1 Tax=Spodoptera littoralis TaxID=7109 RepID=A0A9P0IFZ0_SPOLI|nr:unnamed protein product [Spodoptera littoralis]CAH1646559.1 unnamed protein product [Spodoptera littoralis]